jgi:uncharacterized protein (DUF305 family)
MNKNNALLSVAVLLVGLIIGFSFGKQQGSSSRMVHQMPDGSMMSNNMSMASMMAEMNEALAGKKGNEFDKAFIDEMIVHHQGAIDMAKLALTNANHQEIKDLANAIIKAQTEEIDQMKAWRASWYK